MRLLVFGDTHGSKSAIKRIIKKASGADIVICLGDLTNWGHNLENLLLKFKNLKSQFLFIHGNHEYIGDVKKVVKKHGFIQFLHQRSYSINNYVFFGYGGGGFLLEDLKFENIIKRFKKTIKKNDKVILITHAPPYGTKLDILPYTGHAGNKSFTKFIKEIKPIYHLCGHFHENESKRDKINNTIILNPGPEGKIIRI